LPGTRKSEVGFMRSHHTLCKTTGQVFVPPNIYELSVEVAFIKPSLADGLSTIEGN
jgi:hypothetical protein